MRGRATRGIRAALVLAAAAVQLAPAPHTDSTRVLAIGDIHGSLAGLTTILQETGLTDAAGRWSGGRAHLIQTGDFTDRGAGVRAVMDLLIELQSQASAAGGGVTVLLGNHELLNLMRHDDDVAINPKIYASFVDERSTELRQKALEDWRRWRDRRDRLEGLAAPMTATEEQWLERHPPGFIEYHQAMSAKGRYGRWLRTLPVVHRVGETVFLHGGLSDTFAAVSLDRINELHREEIKSLDQTLARLERGGVIPPHFTWTEIAEEIRARLDAPEKRQRALLEDVAQRLDRFLAVTNSPDSPLWYRGFARPPQGLGDEELEALRQRLVEAYDAHRFVVAHSPFHGREIAVRLKAFFLIDTGMLASVYRGQPSALEFAGDEVVAIYPGQRQLLVPAVRADGESSRAPAAPGALRARLSGPAAPTIALAASGPQGTGPNGSGTTIRPPRRWPDRDGKTLPFTTADEVERFLSEATVLASKPVGEGKTGARLVELELDGVRARGIFHHVDDRRHPASSGAPVRLSGGTAMMRFRDSYSGQVAAYQLAKLMGLDNVPPAVLRKVDRAMGSLALWIEGGTNLTNWRRNQPRQPQNPYYQQQFWDMRIFDALSNNKDRNTGNIFWTSDWNMWLIDHTRTFAHDPDLYRPNLVQRCSRDLLERIERLDERETEKRLKPYLSVFEIKAIFKRRKRLVRHLRDRIDKLGEERVLFNYGDPTGQIVVVESGPGAA